jgi:ribosomal protein S8
MAPIHQICNKVLAAARGGSRSTWIPHSDDGLQLMQLLRRHGFLTAVMLGNDKGPHEHLMRSSSSSSSLDNNTSTTRMHNALMSALGSNKNNEGNQNNYRSLHTSSMKNKNEDRSPSMPSPGELCIWINLRYTLQDATPALRDLRCISRPSARLYATPNELALIAAGRRCERLERVGNATGIVTPLLPGEILAIRTPIGVIDLLKAVHQQVGGEVLCSAS